LEFQLYTNKNCVKCPAVKQAIKELEKSLKISVTQIDTDTIEGMSEAAFYSILATPTLIVIENNEEIDRLIGDYTNEKITEFLLSHTEVKK